MVKEVTAVESEDPDILIVTEQLASVRDMQSKLVVEQLRQSAAADVVAQRQSVAAAHELEQQDQLNARISQHDRAFAQRLASVDEYTWRQVGDEIEEPIEVDPPRKRACRGGPAGVERGAAGAAGGAGGGPAGRLAAGGAAGPCSSTVPTPGGGRMTTCAQAAAAAAGGAAGPSATTSRRGGGGSGSGAGGSSSGAGGSGGAAGPSRNATAGGSAAAAAPVAAAVRRGPTTECLSCCDRFPDDEVTCAGADGASSSSGAAGCGHYFCRGCLTSYVRGVVGDRKFPVLCPMGGGGAGAAGAGCKQQLSREAARHALRGHPKDLQAFDMLEAESGIDENLRIYCPHKSCSVLLIRPEEHDIPADQPMSCPSCRRAFCVRCRIPGWHKGYTCAQFQALPAHLRSAEDAAMLVLSSQHRWKQCPQCQLMVDRSEGCNHMKCRCGCDFCYACGKKYKNNNPTADNVHGTPACECKLFDVPEEEAEPAGGGGAAGGAAGVEEPVRPVPWRGGRQVSRRRCRFAASIHDCPHRFKCWFRHNEDGNF
ncbi:hypothetical protein HYH02_000717 [Chlamydomonas schloesseri]|uniref:RBR-type E3 ubiquitin transferase n=1 Tax=Chlamydomonas schloesseri TaxID=2026947 RepID=A0A835WWC9_9CHLO|nr:hypothetical protein HYH02_000717 [Chlamydomonas schloesseri]|eukprot:KAG2454886.1 hypothetical protein HYH02_000717 [Chlamydomonas schloesseri]